MAAAPASTSPVPQRLLPFLDRKDCVGSSPPGHGGLDPHVQARGALSPLLEELPGLGNAQHGDVTDTGLARRRIDVTLQFQGELLQRVSGTVDRLLDLAEVDLRRRHERVSQVLGEGVNLYSVGANLAP